ncbi:hypothetical protein LVD15_23170 [Fulvivirga maritima]|uniref:hypothetical protein n=1 Tax=Fulvivirga maritima TaxID=2904247 RepID=UPI001F1799B2|nr:hypothetical protein [Fulvivirga maritima]UII26171.1 hypothetical protein LVD15_23170 [Fulvivirga maritima]
MVDEDLLVLAKNDDGQYFLAEINKKNGEINEVHSPSEFQYDERFQYRLWSGAGFAKSAQYLVACYISNHIYINKC